jgi:hypothetical protein
VRRTALAMLLSTAIVKGTAVGTAGQEAWDQLLISTLRWPAILLPDAKRLVARERRFVDAREIGSDRLGNARGTDSVHPP